MKLHDVTRIHENDAGLDTTGLAAINGEDESLFAHAEVAILDRDVLDDDYFEPDGVNDFVRDHGSWDPDRDC